MKRFRRPINSQKRADAYEKIRSVDGDHPIKTKVPFSYVEYQARQRPGGRVLYFNFELAKEMGLIAADHPNKLTEKLCQSLIETFGIIIINEYDFINNNNFEKIKKNTFMATRYLQLQHPDKRGITSGDGRSIWNGIVRNNGQTWDITSCGTGATCLSPAYAKNEVFYKSGDPTISYGCGYAMRAEGITQAVFSEILHRNEVPTERTLAVIQFPKGFAVNVRAGKNLLRPSHFFNHLKQGQFERCKNILDFYIDRQVSNKAWPKPTKGQNLYDHALEMFSDTFSEMVARFESEYIFCWLDWDGDNILADGGIIDYGSIRQFGLFHKDYRFDDVERFSTSILEQKQKAKYIIQTMAQLCDYVKTGEKKPIRDFVNHRVLKRFDKNFKTKTIDFLLWRIGVPAEDIKPFHRRVKLLKQFLNVFRYFEYATSCTGMRQVADGITRDAVFSMRDVLRELPRHLLENDFNIMSFEEFMTVARSDYAVDDDVKLTSTRKKKVQEFQGAYLKLMKALATDFNISLEESTTIICERSAIINRSERVTGDSIIHVSERLLQHAQRLDDEKFHELFYDFVNSQVLNPNVTDTPYQHDDAQARNAKRIRAYMKIVKDGREGI